MKKKIIALALTVFMLLGVTYVYAQGPGVGWGPKRMSESWASKGVPPLTPDQIAKFQELRQKFTAETAKLRGELLTKRLELQSLWTNPKADDKAIVEKEKELRDLQNQLKDKALQFRLESRKFLTPEQIAGLGLGCGPGRRFGGQPMMRHGWEGPRAGGFGGGF
jgi:Spy/CpxP family protein refolding chaperone